jgi:prepilin-type N-terminal cleavage/methylation domain-containing protein
MTDRGFSMIELLIALTVSALLVAALVTALAPARAAFDATPATLELQQRARLGLEFVASAMRSAGTQLSGSDQPLVAGGTIPAVIPELASGATSAFSEIEVFSVIAGGARGVLGRDQPGAGAPMTLMPGGGCPRTPDVCGFTVGALAAISDGQGRFDVFEVGSTDAAQMSLTAANPLSTAYLIGARLFEVDTFRFSLGVQPDGSKSLIRTTWSGAAQPVVDGVSDFAITLVGEASAPQITWDGVSGWAEYGPQPPALAWRDGQGAWPAGESCMVWRDAIGPKSRLTDRGGKGTLVPLARSDLEDGPWCAGGSTGSYDADLLRIRHVNISLRLEALPPTLRGPAGQLFRRGGTNATSAARWVPDRTVAISVSLRNLR